MNDDKWWSTDRLLSGGRVAIADLKQLPPFQKKDRISGMSGLTGIRRSLRFGGLISGQAVRRKIRDAFGSAGIAVGQYDDRVAVLQEVE